MGVKSKQTAQITSPPLPEIVQSTTPHRSNSINDILRHQQQMQQSSPNTNLRVKKPQSLSEYANPLVQTLGIDAGNDQSALTAKKKSMRGLLADWMVNSSVSLTYEQILAHHQEQQQQQMLQQVLDANVSQSSVFPQPQHSRNIFQATTLNQPSYNASAIIQSSSQQLISLKDQQKQPQQQQQQQLPTLPAIRTRQPQESPQKHLETPSKSIVSRTHTHSSSLPPTSSLRNQSNLLEQPLEKLITNNAATTKISLGPQSGQFISNPLDFSSLSRQRLLSNRPSYSLQTSEASDSPRNTPNHIQIRSNTQQYSEENSPLTPNSEKLHLNNGYALKGSNIQKWTDSNSSSSSPNSNPFALKLSSSIFNKIPSSLESTILPVLTASFAANPISKPRAGSEQANQKSNTLKQSDSSRSINVPLPAKPSLFSKQTNKSKSQHNNTDRDTKDTLESLNSNSISKTEPSSKEEIEDIDDKQQPTSTVKNKTNNNSQKISLKELKSQLLSNQDSKLQQTNGKTYWKPRKDNSTNKQQQLSQSTSSSDEDEEREILNLKKGRVSMEDEDTVQLHEAWDLDSPKKSQGSSTIKIKSILKIKSPPEKVKVDYVEEDEMNKGRISASKQTAIPKGISQTRPNSRERKDEEIDAPKPNRKQRQVKKQNSLGDFSEFISKKKCVNFRETLNIIHIDKGKDVVEKVRRKLPAA